VNHNLLNKWTAALLDTWEPLEHIPVTEGQSAAVALHAGLSAWAEGERHELVERAVDGDRDAFLTLALRDWPADAHKRIPALYLPTELTLCQEVKRERQRPRTSVRGPSHSRACEKREATA